MRQRVILVLFLCLLAGAFATAQVFHLGLHVDAVFGRHDESASLQAPSAVVAHSGDTSTAAPPSEQTTSVGGEPSESSPAGSGQADKSKIGGAAVAADATSRDGGVKLDLAEISTSGSTSVFAGHAAPGASVTVLENGVAVASATANANGDWSLATDHKFAGPDPKFSLRAGPAKSQDEARAEADKAASDAARLPAASGGEGGKPETSPSVALLKNFENVVAAARDNALAKEQTESSVAAAKETPPLAPSVGGPSSQVSVLSPAPGDVPDSGRLPSATIPVPMTFVFDEATLTPDGEKTARLLLDYLQLKKFKSVSLSGHADERGTAEYNMDLSRKRLDTVAAFLRSGGYEGKLDLVPEGSTEPFTGIDRSKFSRDELMQLDRRVELRNAM